VSAARFFPYAASLLLDFAYAIIAVCALSRNTWASPLRTLACLLLCVLLVASTWWQSRLEAPSGAIQRSCVIAAAGSALCVIGSLVLSSRAVASAEREELLAIEDFDEETVDALIERAADHLLQQAFVEEVKPEEEMQLPLDSVEGLDESVIAILQEKGLHTQEDLADLSVDELMTYTGMNQEQASALILKAREPWFRG